MTLSAALNTKDCRPKVIAIEKIDTDAGFRALEPEWNVLLNRTEFHTVFQMHQWYLTWWNVFGSDRRLNVLRVTNNARLVGIAPFMLSGRSGRGTLEFMGAGNTDYADIIADREVKHDVIRAVVDYLTEHRSDWDEIVLSQITERSLTIPSLREVLAGSGLSYRIDEIEQCYAYVYEGPDEDRKSFDAGIGNYRNLRNSVNYFNKNGGMAYESITNRAEIERRLPEVFMFHWNRWKETLTPSKFLNQADRDFYYEITRTFAPLGIARLETLSMGGRAVAYVYSFNHKNNIYLYTSALNIVHNKKSPGIVLYYQITDLYIRNGFDSVDYLRGGEQYKGRLTNRAYGNYQVVVYGNSLKYRLVTAYHWFKSSALGRKLIASKRLKELQARLALLRREYGSARMLYVLPALALRKACDHRTILIWSFGEPESSASTDLDLTIRKLTIDDLDQVATFYGAEAKSRKHQVLENRFKHGADCYAAFHNEFIVGLLWGEFGETYLYDINMTFKLRDDEVALVDGATIPQFRGHHIHGYLLAHAMREWWQMGHRTKTFTRSNNHAVFPVLKQCGGIVTGKIRSLRLFGRELFHR